jgi:hypothetical protein
MNERRRGSSGHGRTTLRNLASALALSCVLCAAAPAQDPSSSHEAAAVELLELMDIEAQMAGGAAAMANAMVQQNPALAPYRDVILAWAATFMTWEVFGPRFVSMYTETFTAEELRAMTAFYRTPTGQKALRLQPELMNRGALIGNEEAMQRQADLQSMLEARATELGAND